MKKNRSRVSVPIIAFLVFSFLSPGRAQAAVSLGDAALNVAVATAAGAVLGASTLPFYEDSGKHTKNIFYGAAFGAVFGVLLAAYAGVKEGPTEDEEEEARLNLLNSQKVASPSRSFPLTPEKSTALQARSSFHQEGPIFWSPITQIRF